MMHCWEEAASEPDPRAKEQLRGKVAIGFGTGPDRLMKREAQRSARESHLSKFRQSEAVAQPEMTIARFVETAFVPEHVEGKRMAGRAYYQAILKHVLPPEEVDRIFHIQRNGARTKLKVDPDWPYLGDLLLEDCGPEHVGRLISAAVARGYSPQTVIHIRNVISAIFSHAKKMQCYQHDNPAKRAVMPQRPYKEPHSLTISQAKEVIRAMRYPEKEMTLMAMLTSMNIAEICGLQWKHVNLTGTWSNVAGEPIPPITLVVRKRWYRGELDDVSASRARNLPIPELLLPILIKLSGRGKSIGPEDFVLVSRAGTPINAINITARRLRTIGNQLKMPWLTWHVFRRGQFALEAEFGAQYHYHLASLFNSEPLLATMARDSWSSTPQLNRINAV
jgi:integrase